MAVRPCYCSTRATFLTHDRSLMTVCRVKGIMGTKHFSLNTPVQFEELSVLRHCYSSFLGKQLRRTNQTVRILKVCHPYSNLNL